MYETIGVSRSLVPESVLESLAFQWLQSLVLAVWADPGWMGAKLRAEVARVVAMPAGPQLMMALSALPQGACPADHRDGGIALDGMPRVGSAGNPCLCMVAVAAAWQACQGYAGTRARAAIVDAVGVVPLVLPRDGLRQQLADPAREELAAALRISPDSTSSRIEGSRHLIARPELIGLAEQGVLPEASAVRIAGGLDRLSPEDATSCAAELSRRVRCRIDQQQRPWTGTDAAACSRRLAARCESFIAARNRAVAGRHVRRWSNSDGTATFSAVLPDVVAERMYRRLTAMARALDDDPRPIDARRADLLADLVLGGAESRASGVEVNVIIDVGTLLGMRDGLAEVPGLGPIPCDVARDLAADGAWRAWIRDASGAVVATGSAMYTPGAAVARLVRAREAHCRMPGCRRPSQVCDLDHATPWPRGRTTVKNLGPLCRRHHNLKTHAGWALDADDPMEQTWRTPAGAVITDRPESPWFE